MKTYNIQRKVAKGKATNYIHVQELYAWERFAVTVGKLGGNSTVPIGMKWNETNATLE